MKAVLACRQHELPFSFKVTIDRRKALHLDGFVQFAARLGAASLQLAPLLPTDAVNAQDTLPIAAQREFLREVSLLRSTTRLALDLAAGFYDPRAEPTCGPLLERTLNVDYKGRLVLCTILAGFRGQREETDVVGRLDESALATLLPTLTDTIATRNEERTSAFRELRPRDQPSMRLGSNCLDCLCSFGKIDPGSLEDSLEIRSMDDNLSFRVPDAIISSEFNGTQGLLLDTRTQRYHTLNETATFLWLAVEQGRTVVQMADALCKEFAVDVARARESVEAAMVRFESQSLVEA
ncbi:MAG: PqqD family protein, partial [Vicinamibacteria bacterium]